MTDTERNRIMRLLAEPEPATHAADTASGTEQLPPAPPLSPALRARILQAAREQAAREATAPVAAGDELAVRRRRPGPSLLRFASVAVAAAASVLFFVGTPTGPLARYDLTVARVLKELGDKGPPVALAPDAVLDVDLAPRERVRGRVVVQAYRSRPGESPTKWSPPLVEVRPGAFRLVRAVRDLPDLTPGRWVLTFVVGRAGALPSDGEIAAAIKAGDDGHGDWSVATQEIEVRAADVP